MPIICLKGEAMLKLIFRMMQLTAFLGLLAALPKIISVQRNALEFVNAIAAQGNGASQLLGNPLPGGKSNPLLAGKSLQSQGATQTGSMSTLMQLLGQRSGNPAGATGESSPSEPKAVPLGPSTVIYQTKPDASRGKSAKTAVMELPPGASAIFVDGRLQIYHPSAKPRKGQ
jgi:hypothetical protein